MKTIYDQRVSKVVRSLVKEDRSRIINLVDLFKENGFNIPPIYLKKLTKAIWEFRADRYRLLFGLVGSTAVITNIFLKKTQKTPKREIKLAVKRLKQYEN